MAGSETGPGVAPGSGEGRDRHLDWEGCWNARDLGGLRAADGRMTRSRAVVRSDCLHGLTADGWAAAQAYGIRTLVDLRNGDQRAAEPQAPPPGLATVHVPLEEGLDEDPEFARWAASGWLSTPLYYGRFLARWPDRVAAAVTAVAQAEPGGVVVHCGKGCDRTGLIVMVLLALVGVSEEEMVDDYELTAVRLRSPVARRLGRDDDSGAVQAVLGQAGTSAREVILSTLRSFDLVAVLSDAGLETGDLIALRSRLVAQDSDPEHR
jgi:protein-tyrosine phosphatase